EDRCVLRQSVITSSGLHQDIPRGPMVAPRVRVFGSTRARRWLARSTTERAGNGFTAERRNLSARRIRGSLTACCEHRVRRSIGFAAVALCKGEMNARYPDDGQ